MKHRRRISFSMLWLIVILSGLGMAEDTRNQSMGQLTVAVNAICKGAYAESDDFFRGQDSLTVNYQGIAIYNVNGIIGAGTWDLEMVSFHQTLSGSGGGAVHTEVSHDTWKYNVVNPAWDYPAFNPTVIPSSGEVFIELPGFIYPSTVFSSTGEYQSAYAAANAVMMEVSGLTFRSRMRGSFNPKDRHWTTSGTLDRQVAEIETMQGTFSANFKATFSPVPQPADQLEAVVIPAPEYTRWIPEAGKDSETPGNTITIQAKLQVKGHPKEAPKENARFKFELVEVSREPGICLNTPVENPSDGPDLRFNPKDNPHLTVWEGGQVAVDKELGQESEVIIEAHDWGAYGYLKVTAVTESGKTVIATIQGQPGKHTVELPYDANQNKIADAWEKAQGILPADTGGDWDEESQKGNNNHGDGFTLYEEYRGVIARGQHRRLNPLAKDLVVENPYGDLVRPGLALFESASGIQVTELKAGELAADRVVNINNQTYHRGAQHGLKIEAVRFKKPGRNDVEDESTLAAALPERMHRSPKDCTKIGIRKGYVHDYFDPTVKNVSKNEIRAAIFLAVAHEMAHALSVQHHGDDNPPRDMELRPGSPATAYDEQGKELPKPVTIDSNVGAVGGPGSGDIRCIMSYAHYYNWCYFPKQNSFRMVPKQAAGTIFCTHSQGTGINANNHYFGGAAPGRGNCLGKMQVKDYE